MDKKQKTDRGKVWLFLPLLVLPLLALGFYALGGGRGNSEDGLSAKAGINTSLPDASFSKDSLKSKSEYYDQAEKMASKSDSNGIAMMAEKLGFGSVGLEGTSVSGVSQTREIEGKLEAIQREMNRTEVPVGRSVPVSRGRDVGMKSEVDRLEMLMRSMQQSKGEDAEMAQLNNFMQGILDVQHPERVMARGQLDADLYPDSAFRAIPAVIEGNQKVAQGAVVKLRLIDSVRLKGLLVPAGQLLFGACNITNQRLLLTIKNIRLGTSIIPVDMSVFSLDGLPGINAPDAELSRAAGEGTVGALGGMNVIGFDGSIGMQAASAGIDAARGLIGRKVKRIKVKLKGGQKVLLRNNAVGR
jgi:hypothetical protein